MKTTPKINAWYLALLFAALFAFNCSSDPNSPDGGNPDGQLPSSSDVQQSSSDSDREGEASSSSRSSGSQPSSSSVGGSSSSVTGSSSSVGGSSSSVRSSSSVGGSSSSVTGSSSSVGGSSSSVRSSSSAGPTTPVDESVHGDYSKPERWISAGGDKSKGADIFLATPTGNISGGASYASFEDAKASATSWGRGVEGLFRDATNIYHAVYRYSCIGCSGGGMDGLSTRDIIAAFEYYWENYNKGERPFILLGFSQGAYVLWNVLLKYIDKNPEIQKYHIVTYALGSPGRGDYSIDRNGSIKNGYFSQSPTDLNKVVCFSPYHEDDDVSGMGAAFKVTNGSPTNNPITNPISWTTDTAYYACGTGQCSSNVSGAKIDYADKGVLIVNTTAKPNGSWGYHGQETTFFAGSIKQNILDRIAAWNAK